jgi:hypothetical protein
MAIGESRSQCDVLYIFHTSVEKSVENFVVKVALGRNWMFVKNKQIILNAS